MLGATGHVGHLLRAAPVPALTQTAIWHSRTGLGANWGWDILNEDPSDVAFDAVFHLARGGSVAHEVEIAERVCDLAAGRPVLYASSQAVYTPNDEPLSEDALVEPTTTYGEAKAAAEQVVSSYSMGLSLRIGNVAGADMLFKAMAMGPVVLDRFADGVGPRRSYIGPSTLARTVVALAASFGGPRQMSAVNCASPASIQMEDCLDAADAAWEWRPAPDGALAVLELDTSRLQSLLPLPAVSAKHLVNEACASGWRRF